MSDNANQHFPVGSAIRYTADFTNALPTGETVSAVTWTITPQAGSPLSPTVGDQVDDFANNKSSIEVAGCLNAERYVLQALGTFTDGQIIAKDISLQSVNG
jgi:hypothetical protein